MSRSFLVPILLPADPAVSLEAAPKQYVDSKTQGSAFFEFMFSTSTTEPPTGAEIRLNGTTAAATKVWVRNTTYDGVDISRRLLVQGVSGTQFYIQDKDNAANYAVFNVTADAIDKTTYVELPVTWNRGGGTIPAQRVIAGVLNSPSGGSVSGTKLSALTAITGAVAATTDVVEVLDVSDTTMAASGTNKKITLAELVIFLNANGIMVVDDGITNAKLANAPANTLKGNNTASTADPVDMTVTQAKTLLAYTAADVSAVPTARTLTTTAPIQIGGTTSADLSANRTLSILGSSEAAPGAVELATAAETLTGTDNTRAVHTAGLAPLVSGGGPLFGFLFDTTTTAGTSTNGLRLNNATPASATAVYVNYTCREGVDLKTRLLAGTAGDRLYIQDRANSANYRVYELTGAPTDVTTYATVAVVHRGGGGSLWANGAAIVAGFTAPPITVGTVAPLAPLTNDLWIDTN